MVTSSTWTALENGERHDVYKQTTSGILVVDEQGEPLITVATHGFETDGLIYYPNPISESIIGKIGLGYTNQTFGTDVNPEGVEIAGISPGYPPHLRRYDILDMNNPYHGVCGRDGNWCGAQTGYRKGKPSLFVMMGAVAVHQQGSVVGLFRFKIRGDEGCPAISAAVRVRDMRWRKSILTIIASYTLRTRFLVSKVSNCAIKKLSESQQCSVFLNAISLWLCHSLQE